MDHRVPAVRSEILCQHHAGSWSVTQSVATINDRHEETSPRFPRTLEKDMTRTAVRTVPSTAVAFLLALALAVAAVLVAGSGLSGSDDAGATWNRGPGKGATWNSVEAGATWNRGPGKGATWN
jgi:hypothetical protein